MKSPRTGGALLGAAVLAVACHPPPPRTAPAAPKPSAVADALSWVAEDVVRAEQAGAGPATAVARGAGAAGDSLGGRFAVAADSCALFLAGGSSSLDDIDVFVYGDDGAVLASDESTARSASALLCPPHPANVYVFARVAAGHGLVSLSAQAVPVPAADRLRTAFRSAGARGPFGAAADAEGWPELDEALLSHRAELGGAWRELRRVAIPVDAAVASRLSVAVEGGRCIDALAVPADAVAFVELTALDTAGRIVGRAATDARSPALLLCARERTDVTLELRPHAGSGAAAVVLSEGEPRPPGEARGAILLGPGATLPLAQARVRLDDQLRRRGYGAPRAIAEGTASVGTRARTDLDLPAGCHRLDGIGGAPLRQLELWLWSASDQLLARGGAEGGAALFACGPGGRAHLDVEVLGASGPYAVEARTLGGAPAVLAQHPLAASRLLAELEGTARFERLLDSLAVRAVTATPAALATASAEVAAGGCALAVAALDSGAEGLLLRALDAGTNAEISRSTGAHSAKLDVCATEPAAPRQVRFELVTTAGASTALFASRAWTPKPPSPPEGGRR